MQYPAATDQQFCWEQISRIRPTFRLSYPYAPQQFSAGLLALYALFAAIEELQCRVSDTGVARTKLNWWRQQLLGQDYRTSDHPIIRQLSQTEVLSTGAKSHLKDMLEIELDRLDKRVPKDERELKSNCIGIGYHPMRLEFSLQGDIELGDGLEGACAVNGLVQLMRESSRTSMEPYWWVPESLLTHHGLRRFDLQNATGSQAPTKILSQLCDLGLTWAQVGALNSRGAQFPKRDLKQDQGEIRGHQHWFIQTALNIRLLKKLRGRSLTEYAEKFATTGLGDVWYAWRCARQHATAQKMT